MSLPPLTILDVIQRSTAWLQQKQIAEAKQSVHLLLCDCLNIANPIHLYTRYEEPLSQQQIAQFRQLLKQRGQGKPISYILGKSFFIDEWLQVTTDTLIPRPETEELVQLVLTECLSTLTQNTSPLQLLDIGTGSGAIGISIHRLAEYAMQTTLCDISKSALAIAENNAHRLLSKDADWCCIYSDLFSHITSKFHCITANLPYIPRHEKKMLSNEVLQEPHTALFSDGEQGEKLIFSCVKQAANYLHDYGFLVLEVGYQQAEIIMQYAQSLGCYRQITSQQDLQQISRFIILQK